MKITRSKKIGVSLVVALGVIFVSPILFTWSTARTLEGYYAPIDGISCACGHSFYPEIRGTNMYRYIPGHRERNHRYVLTPITTNEWVVSRAPHLTDKAPLEFPWHIRLIDGEAFEGDHESERWVKMERQYNPWPLWIAWLRGGGG